MFLMCPYKYNFPVFAAIKSTEMNNVLQSLVQHVAKSVCITRLMMTNRQKVLQAIIHSPGMVVNIRHMVKNIRKITTQTAKGEFNKYLLWTFCDIYATIR